MTRKTKVMPRKEQLPQEENPASLTDRPLFDLSDAAIKKLMHTVEKCGYVTHDQISALSNEINSEQIEGRSGDV